jgi:hypothetical protein
MSLEPLVKIEDIKNALEIEALVSLKRRITIYRPKFDLVREGLVQRDVIDVQDLAMPNFIKFGAVDLSFVFNRLYNHSGTGPILPDLSSDRRAFLLDLHLAHQDMTLALSSEYDGIGEYGDLGAYIHSRGEPKLLTPESLSNLFNSRIAESPLIFELYTLCAKKGTRKYELETYQTDLVKHLTEEE